MNKILITEITNETAARFFCSFFTKSKQEKREFGGLLISSKGKIYAVYETNPKSTQTSVQYESGGLIYEAEKKRKGEVQVIETFHTHPPHTHAESPSKKRRYPHEVSGVPSPTDLQSDKISVGARRFEAVGRTPSPSHPPDRA